jgi:hypothetical protein
MQTIDIHRIASHRMPWNCPGRQLYDWSFVNIYIYIHIWYYSYYAIFLHDVYYMFNMDYKYKHVHQIHKWPSTFRIDCMWDCVAWPDTWPWPWTGQSSLEAAMWDCVACHVRLCSGVGLMCTLIAVWQSSGQPDHLKNKKKVSPESHLNLGVFQVSFRWHFRWDSVDV